jgi:malate synthase
MIINALNSGAKTMADLEDSNAPSWKNTIEGQQNLIDANKKTISLVDVKRNKYTLNQETAVLLVRPRGLHLDERHIIINNEKASGSLVDFGLYVFHTQTMMHNETAPYFYLQN